MDPIKATTVMKKHPNLPPLKKCYPIEFLRLTSSFPRGSFVKLDNSNAIMIHPCDRMIPLVNRLIRRFKSFDTIIEKLESIGYLDLDINSLPSGLHLLRFLSHTGNHDLLVHTYHHLVKFHAFVPNTFAKNLLMDSLFTTGQSQFAFSFFLHINSPNFYTFDIALFHLSHLNDIANISHVLTHMLRMGYYPSYDAFNKLLYSFCEINAIPRVYQLLGLMVVKLGVEIDLNVWTLLMTKFIELESFNEINAMLSAGFVPQDKDSCIAHAHAVLEEVRNVAASGVFHIQDCDYKSYPFFYLTQVVDSRLS